MRQQDPRRSNSIAAIAQALRPALRVGVRAGHLASCAQLLALDCVRARADDPTDLDSLAFALEAVLLEALRALGDGPYGRSARLLFGAVPDTRGRPLKDRRRLAAAELDLMPSTFRHNYENEILIDVAAEIARRAQKPRPGSVCSGPSPAV